MIIRGGKRTQCTGHCAVLVLWNSPSSLFSPNSNQFCNVTWPLLPSSPISLSLLIVVIFLSSCGCKVLLSCLLIFTSSICTLSVYFLFETPSCSCLCPPLASENLFVGSVLLPTPPTPTYVISSCACGWLLYLFSPVFVLSFLSLGLLVCMVVYFQLSSLKLIHLLLCTIRLSSLGSMGFAPWLSCLAGELAVSLF